MPESFVNQATGRCSVDGSKFWFNCNPAGPYHWFKVNWIDEGERKRLLYLHCYTTRHFHPMLELKVNKHFTYDHFVVIFTHVVLLFCIIKPHGYPRGMKKAPAEAGAFLVLMLILCVTHRISDSRLMNEQNFFRSQSFKRAFPIIVFPINPFRIIIPYYAIMLSIVILAITKSPYLRRLHLTIQ